MEKTSRIFVAGHRGLVGSAIASRLRESGYSQLLTRTHQELDLSQQGDVNAFFEQNRPEYVILAAAKVGGILANDTLPAEFFYINAAIQINVVHAAWRTGVKRLLFLGSSCIYPRECPQPMKEDYLLTGPLEPTNLPYAVAKISGIVQCEAYNRQYGTKYLAAMPTNLYGENDNFDLTGSHVLPAMIRKFHLAKLASTGSWDDIVRDEKINGSVPDEFKASLVAISHKMGLAYPADWGPSELPEPAVPIWGTGSPMREFLHVRDLADACVHLMNLDDTVFDDFLKQREFPLVNIGCGSDIAIKDLALLIRKVVGFEGELVFDTTKPDGTPRKLLDVSLLEGIGWSAGIELEDGIRETYAQYQARTGKTGE